jgi:hypothetical protein
MTVMMRILARRVFGVAVFAAMAATASAQPAAPASPAPSDDVQFIVAPYLVFAGMSGTVGVKGYDQTVDMSASDVLSNLKAGFMGYFGAKKDKWGFGADIIYSKLGAAATKGPITIEPTASTGLYTFLASRELKPGVDLIFGARVTSTTTTLAFTAPVVKSVEGTKTWVDPVAGVNIAVPVGEKAKFTMLADLGGFGTSSTISVDLLPAVQVRVAKHASLAFGWRYIYDDYSDDAGFVYKVTIQGPLLGFVFPF